jgi:hypothetical protein
MPRAPELRVDQRRAQRALGGLAGAVLAPDEKPMPISAVPEPSMIVRTSAKSRLIRPGSVIRSQMP